MRSAADARAPRSTELSVAKKSLMPEMQKTASSLKPRPFPQQPIDLSAAHEPFAVLMSLSETSRYRHVVAASLFQQTRNSPSASPLHACPGHFLTTSLCPS